MGLVILNQKTTLNTETNVILCAKCTSIKKKERERKKNSLKCEPVNGVLRMILIGDILWENNLKFVVLIASLEFWWFNMLRVCCL